MKVDATRFIRSAAGPADFPADGDPEIALVGRSNVGKSSLINALVRQNVARTSAAPGKTRLVNLYRVEVDRRGGFYLADLPGYGHAGGGEEAARGFDRLTADYFRLQVTGDRLQGGIRGKGTSRGQVTGDRLQGGIRGKGTGKGTGDRLQGTGKGKGRRIAGIVLAIDARHPGLASDVGAYRWLLAQSAPVALIAMKIDKLSQAERARTDRHMETSFGVAALPVSAVTGEGLEQLWRLLLTWIRPR